MNANQDPRGQRYVPWTGRHHRPDRELPGGQHPTQLPPSHNAAKHILYTQANSAAMAFVKDGRDLCPERPRRH